MIVSNILRRKGRTAITVLAVAVSCALLVSMLSISEGIMENAREAIKVSKVDVTLSGPISGAHDISGKLESDRERVRVASPSYYSSLVLSPTGNGVVSALAEGVIPEKDRAVASKEETERLTGGFDTMDDPFFQNGTYAGGTGSPHFTGEMLISSHLAADYELGIGDTIDVIHRNDTVPFRITGIFEVGVTDDAPFRLYFAVIHLSELQYLSALDGTPVSEYDRADKLSIYLTASTRSSVSRVEAFAGELEQEYQLYSVTTKKDQLEGIEHSVAISTAYYGALGSVAVSIGMLFVVCIVIMNIAERTKEIGILRAIGMRRRSIFTMFFLESLAMAFAGSVLGVLLGVTGSHYLGLYIAGSFGIEKDITVVTLQLVLFSMVATNVLGGLASLYPGFRASRMRIVEAMKSD